VILVFVVIFVGMALVLMSVALVTLFERLLLALSQLRKGPNKVALGGLIQPLIDGVKLLVKVFLVPFQSFYGFIFFGSVCILWGMSIV
jgi:NADH-quinone oxidoreductase subunit H